MLLFTVPGSAPYNASYALLGCAMAAGQAEAAPQLLQDSGSSVPSILR